MDRRSFLKSAGMSAAGTAFATDIFAEAAEKGSTSPQFLSGTNRDRSQIQSTDLTPWAPSAAQPWDVHTINHLYRRAGFGASLAEIAIAQGKNYSDVVDGLLNDAFLTQPTDPAIPGYSADTNTRPSWLHVPPYVYTPFGINVMLADYAIANMKVASHWTVQMNHPDTMLREKFTLFWMNHFAVESKKAVYPQYMYGFLTYFRNNAWGNFKKMVSDVSIQPAMLSYLDGVLNVGTNPNENYARELQELFTMGVTDQNGKANYTQDDVEALAKVFSGWTIDLQAPPPNILPPLYNPSLHNSSYLSIYDGSQKLVYNLSSSGAAKDMDIIDHIFTMRGNQIAWYICSKLYQYFVYHDISGTAEQSVIQAMATLFQNSNWEIKPVISALLKSAHFFDEANIGAGIKSPIEHLLGLVHAFDIQIDELAGGSIVYYAIAGNQQLLDPPNVKGWPGYHSWISTTTLPYRNEISGGLLISQTLNLFTSVQDGYSNNLKPVLMPTDTVLLNSWAKLFTNYSGTFDDMLSELATYLCAHTPSATALAYVKAQFPSATYEWALLDDMTKVGALRVMAAAIMQLADFQLC